MWIRQLHFVNWSRIKLRSTECSDVREFYCHVWPDFKPFFALISTNFFFLNLERIGVQEFVHNVKYRFNKNCDLFFLM
jgi:hypothetical protein